MPGSTGRGSCTSMITSGLAVEPTDTIVRAGPRTPDPGTKTEKGSSGSWSAFKGTTQKPRTNARIQTIHPTGCQESTGTRLAQSEDIGSLEPLYACVLCRPRDGTRNTLVVKQKRFQPPRESRCMFTGKTPPTEGGKALQPRGRSCHRGAPTDVGLGIT